MWIILKSLFFRWDLTQWYKIIPAGALERPNPLRIGFKREKKDTKNLFSVTQFKKKKKFHQAIFSSGSGYGTGIGWAPRATRETGRHISLNTGTGNDSKAVLTQLRDLAGLMIFFPLIMFLWRSFHRCKKVLHPLQPKACSIRIQGLACLVPIRRGGGGWAAHRARPPGQPGACCSDLHPRWLSSDDNGGFCPTSVQRPHTLPHPPKHGHSSSRESGGSFRELHL